MRRIHPSPFYSRTAACAFWIGCAGLTGCVSPYAGEEEALQRQADQTLQQERFQRITGQVEGLQLETDALRSEMDALRRERSSSSQTELRTLQARLDEMEKRVRESETARVRDREEILNRLSKQMADLLQKGGSGRSSSGSRSGSGSGYEHEVKAGESLSRIAAAYGVSVQTIQDANQMKSDVIRVGQKLFIPEK
jgi:Skp family chaperone for outer membrane proteins